MGQFNNLGGLNLGLDGQSQGIPRGHGRRHSVTVVNKGPSASIGGFNDGFDDGFTAPSNFNGYSRQVSRADNSWRISMSIMVFLTVCLI